MEVILLERIEKLGQLGDIVSVRPGFARNYLLPQRKALRATKDNLAYFEGERARLEAENLARRTDSEALAERLEDVTVVMIRQAGESGQLYGSVTVRDIADGVGEQGIEVDRRHVVLEHPIKTLGLHPVKIRPHPEVSVSIVVNVARSEEEAELQIEAGRAISQAEQEAAAEAAEAELDATLAALEDEELEEGEAPGDGEALGDGEPAPEESEEAKA